MRSTIGRPARALLPLALGALIYLGDGTRVAGFALSLLVARLFSLGAAAAFQSASGRVIREARLRGNFLIALALALVGGAVAIWVLAFLKLPFGLANIDRRIALSGAIIMLTELFSNRLYALTDQLSAPLCDALVAMLVATGFIASRGDNQILLFFSLASLGVCLITALSIGGIAHPRFGTQVLQEIPRALVRVWLPAAILVGFLLIGRNVPMGAFAAAGLALFSWAYAPARRTKDESVPVVALASFASAGAVLVALAQPTLWSLDSMTLFLPLYFACLLTICYTTTPGVRGAFSLLCCTVATAAMGWRLSGAMFFGAAGALPYLAAASAMLAILLLIPDLKQAAHRSRLMRRKRRMERRNAAVQFNED